MSRLMSPRVNSQSTTQDVKGGKDIGGVQLSLSNRALGVDPVETRIGQSRRAWCAWRSRKPAAITKADHRKTAVRLSIRYAGDLAMTHIFAAADAAAVMITLGGPTSSGLHAYFNEKNLIAVAALLILGIVVIAATGVIRLAPTLRWFVAGHEPDANQRDAAMKLVRRQAEVSVVTSVVGAAIFLLLNVSGGLGLVVPVLLGALLGGAAAAGSGLLLAQRTLRPILIAATRGSEHRLAVPGVFSRLMLTWLLCGAFPIAAISALVIFRSNGWIIPKTASLQLPVLAVSLTAVMLGLPIMVLTFRSISDPVGEVVDAMAEVEHGRIGTYVAAYERSHIGRLQSGFNRMVAGLVERDRLHDLFGRHVGADVVRRAVDEGASLSGDVLDAAVLFIDLVGSTRLAASRPPQEVAQVLNDFFRTIVGAVDARHGLINKFVGDAALAVFGVPFPTSEPASAALATARQLSSQLRGLSLVDFGIGVSAGPVFAGNIGAENRYEYTVIGDAVNVAARLADLAKKSDRRVLCSAEAIDRADSAERQRWMSGYSAVLRGRAEATQVLKPVSDA